MIVGMGVVSSFLVLLVLLMKVSGYLLNRTPQQLAESQANTAVSPTGTQASPQRDKINRAIAVAKAYQQQGQR